MGDPKWIAAYKRECATINANHAQVALERKEAGEYIFPEKCIVYRVNVVHEYKWKLDPESVDTYRWLECTRFTADGSKEDRNISKIQVYAATPDISFILFWMGTIAVHRMYVFESDAVRAYLQAPNIDDAIVLMYDEFLQRLGMPKYARIISGFYDTLMAALGFDKFSDAVFKKEGWSKCDVARCMYIKYCEEYKVYIYAVHHSDNYTFASSCKEAMLNTMH